MKRFAFDCSVAFAVGVILMLSFAGCGSTYTLKKGGWVIKQDTDKGTCLIVHGDSDPEVVVVCIMNPVPVQLPKSILEARCPKCPAEQPDGAPEAPQGAEEKPDGAE